MGYTIFCLVLGLLTFLGLMKLLGDVTFAASCALAVCVIAFFYGRIDW